MRNLYYSCLFLVAHAALICRGWAQAYTPTGEQTIHITGLVIDQNGEPKKDARLELCFDGHVLKYGYPAPDGTYDMVAYVYGGIHKVDIHLYYDGYLRQEQKDIELTGKTINLDFFTKENTRVIWPVRHTCGARPFFLPSHGWASQPDHMFRSPYGTFTYYMPGYFDPVVYHTKITQQITITDNSGNPIPEARVGIKVADDETRWGITDEKGRLNLFMQFEKGALKGSILISAEGYHRKILLLQSLGSYNTRTYRLKKVNEN